MVGHNLKMQQVLQDFQSVCLTISGHYALKGLGYLEAIS